MVLNPIPSSSTSKSKGLGDLASELGSEAADIRENEGEAANYGVYFDDTEYDYMQHLRDLGSGEGEGVWVEASASQSNNGKHKESLADALSALDLRDRSEQLLDDDILPSKNLQRVSYQAQQDIPDSIAGFQPDMDPRLREVLEALEDDAYVDDDEDVFKELAVDSQELDEDEFADGYPEDDEEGWESDDTAKPRDEYKGEEVPQLVDVREAGDHNRDDAWFAEFKKFQKGQQGGKKPAGMAGTDMESSVMTTTTNGGRHKKRKGALTSQSAYSMTSSSLVRTEQLTILDARFDKMEKDYGEDVDDMASVSALSTASSVQGPLRSDFDSIMDDFLGNYSMQGKKKVKKGKYQTGLEQLEEIRRGLGPARIRAGDK